MKFISNSAFLLLALSSSALAEPTQTRSLRKGGGKNNSSGRSGKQNSSKRGGKNVRAGDPGTFEFLVTRQECLSFDRLKEGKEAELKDCDRATEFIYRDDLLVQVNDEDEDFCLQANIKDETATIEECDSGNDDQEWELIRVPTRKSSIVYRLKNIGSGLFLEVDKRDEFVLARGNDEAQWFTGPDSDFFETF